MDKKKVTLVLASVLCLSSSVFAAPYDRAEGQGSVRSALSRTDNPYSPYYGKTFSAAKSGGSIKAILAQKKAMRAKAAGDEENTVVKEKTVEKKTTEPKVKESKPFAGAQPLSPVQRHILADKGRYHEPENPTGYYLDGDKVAYPDKTRIIKHKEGKPVKIFMQAKRITDIFLKSDEHIENIIVDNKFGLKIKKTYEDGRYSRWHVSVVPVDNNPGTEMYIRTNQRSYHFYLEPTSDGEGYVPYVRFAYLEDRSEKPQVKENAEAKKETVKQVKPVKEAKAEKAAKPVKVKAKKVSAPAETVNPPVKNVGRGSKTAGGSSEGIELYWSN